MKTSQDGKRHTDMQSAVRKDFRRFRSREPGHKTFWRSMSVIGAVGWPIVLLTLGGALLGRHLDEFWNTGIRLTLLLMFAGVVLGSGAAWHLIQGTRK